MTLKSTLAGLRYIANSPPRKHGGIHQQTIDIAKAALKHLLKRKK